jgi:glucokinase
MSRYVFGVDVGGTTVKLGIFDIEGNVLDKWEIPTRTEENGSKIIPDIAESILSKIKEKGIEKSDVVGIGMGVPGPVKEDGTVVKAVNLGWDIFNPNEELSKLVGVPAKTGNDANVAALGEMWRGGGQGYQDMVAVTLGTGVGGGVIIDGKVFSGFNYAGTELGHIVIEVNGKPCGCGRRGCWEAYSSATGLVNMTKEKLCECESQGRKTVMTDLVAKYGKVNGRIAFEAQRAGDEAGIEVINTYSLYLASGLTSMINIFQPEVLSIGGGISGEGDELIKLVIDTIHREQYGSGFVEPTKVRIAELGNDAGIIGAAFLGI